MPKFAANLSMMFAERSFPERFKAAAEAGFRGVEYLFPYEFSKDFLADELAANQLEQVLFNLPAGNWAAGDRGIACMPGRITEFREGVGRAIEYAEALGCRQINCLTGKRPEGLDFAVAEGVLIENLAYAAAELEKAGIVLLLEPINHHDIPGFLVNTSRHGLSIIDSVGSGNLFLQYDIYHMQRMEGELANTLRKQIARIRHIQIADNPGRHEPGTGEINYEFLFKCIDEIGYDGWVGCEYIPASDTMAGLGWIGRHRTAP